MSESRVRRRSATTVESLESRRLLTAQAIGTFENVVRESTLIGSDLYVFLETQQSSNFGYLSQIVRRDSDGNVHEVRAGRDRKLLNFDGDVYRIGRQIYFGADDQFWRVRGGSNTAINLLPPDHPRDIRIGQVVEHDGAVYFAVHQSGSSASEFRISSLWRTDGTRQGTVQIKQFQLRVSENALWNLTSSGNGLYFLASLVESGSQVWRSDGSSAGTHSVTGFAGAHLSDLTAVGDHLFFVHSSSEGHELALSNGTPAGTRALRGRFESIRILGAAGSRLFFVGSDAAAGAEVWMTDASGSTPTRITDLEAGAADGVAPGQSHHVVTIGSDLYFSTATASPFSTDHPTPRVVKIGADLRPIVLKDVDASTLLRANGKLYYRGRHGDVWASHGTPATTYAVGVNAEHLFTDGTGQAYFSAGKVAPDSYHNDGRTLWRITPRRGAAAGTVWNDLDRDGQRDREPGLRGFRVFADLNNDGVRNRNEPFSRTDAIGNWRIDDLPAGRWTFRLTHVAGWTPTTASAVKLRVKREQTVASSAFGLLGDSGAVAGTVFNDFDGNSRRDGDEPGAQGFRVYVDYDGDRRFDPGEPSVRTDAEGRFNLSGVPSKNQSVRVVAVEGWRPTGYDVDLYQTAWAKQALVNPIQTSFVDFALRADVIIRGTAFSDRNSNGVLDPGEEPFDATVFSDLDGNGQLNYPEPSASVVGGAYSLPARSGNHRIGIIYSGSRFRTYASAFQSVAAVMPGVTEGIDFAIPEIRFTVTVRGAAFRDRNGNGLMDPGEEENGARVFWDRYGDGSVTYSDRVSVVVDGKYELELESGFRRIGLAPVGYTQGFTFRDVLVLHPDDMTGVDLIRP